MANENTQDDPSEVDASGSSHCSTAHVPDASRLPGAVGQWLPMDLKRLWEDATQILVAVPVCSRIRNTRKRAEDDWYYEFSVICIRCDEEYFECETSDGDAWGWDLHSVDWYIQLSQ